MGPPYRGTSLIRNTPLLEPYSRTIPRVIWWSWGGGLFLMSEVPLQGPCFMVVSLPFVAHAMLESFRSFRFFELRRRAPNIGGHRNWFCRKAMLPFGSHSGPPVQRIAAERATP